MTVSPRALLHSYKREPNAITCKRKYLSTQYRIQPQNSLSHSTGALHSEHFATKH